MDSAAIQRVLVVGGGESGSQIALQFARFGIHASVLDLSQDQLESCRRRQKDVLDTLVSHAIVQDEDRGPILGRITFSDDAVALCRDADLVCECVTEDLDVKRTLLRQLDSLCPNETIFYDQHVLPGAFATSPRQWASRSSRGAAFPHAGLVRQRRRYHAPSRHGAGGCGYAAVLGAPHRSGAYRFASGKPGLRIQHDAVPAADVRHGSSGSRRRRFRGYRPVVDGRHQDAHRPLRHDRHHWFGYRLRHLETLVGNAGVHSGQTRGRPVGAPRRSAATGQKGGRRVLSLSPSRVRIGRLPGA